ncbi:MAG TPA: helix-turn-helix domain-containing protein [Candidatus Cryptobacteroides intestinipullorum]|nr:helix-turn-helix domain-containing protein [Candidatus Cryptobacteroides intestinipullorum]
MDNDSVKDNIRNFRKIYKLTQSEMADKLGISRTAYRNIESGETRLISENVSRIADILHIRTEDLVLGYSPEPGQKEKNRRPGSISAQLAEMKRAHEKETEEMSSEIIRLKKDLQYLTRRIEDLEELLKTKDEIISMMKKFESRPEQK